MKRAAVLGLLVLVACKGDKGSSRHHADDDDEGGCKVTATKPAEMVSGKTPGMIMPFTAIKLGMSPADAAKACPNLFKSDKGKAQAGTFSVGEIVGKFGDHGYVHGRLGFTADKLTSVEMSLPAEIADALTAAWGAPKKSAGAKGQALAWFDEATHTRAMLAPEERGERELVVSSYVPLAAFVEQDTKVIPFKANDVLGKTPAELIKQFPQYAGHSTVSAATKKQAEAMMADMKKDLEAKGVKLTQHDDDVEVRLPATPFGAGQETQVVIHTDEDGTVRSYGVWFRTEEMMSGVTWPNEIEDLLKTLDTQWGPHKMVKETLGERHTWFDPKTGVRVSAHVDPAKPGELDLDFVRYMPLANLFGKPGPLWGFEKADRPLIGATPDELKAAYPKGLKLESESATLKLPPTDYEGDTAVTTILMFIRDGKVGQWNVSIPFENYEPAKAEYGQLLDTKLGAGKPKGEHVQYGKTVDARYSDITHELEIEVSK